MPDRQPLSRREVQIIKRMKSVCKVPVLRIAEYLDRNKSTIYAALKEKENSTPTAKGRPPLLTPKEVRRLIGLLSRMIKTAKAKQEVTMAMLLKTSKTKVGAKTVRRALAKRGIRFRKMRCKPLLTTADKRARFAFA